MMELGDCRHLIVDRHLATIKTVTFISLVCFLLAYLKTSIILFQTEERFQAFSGMQHSL
ncbi:hypothetical protein X975_26796, partial [Stegodyphus mimosarum]